MTKCPDSPIPEYRKKAPLSITFHYCPTKGENLPLMELKKLCPPCKKPQNCTAWRKYHHIAFPEKYRKVFGE